MPKPSGEHLEEYKEIKKARKGVVITQEGKLDPRDFDSDIRSMQEPQADKASPEIPAYQAAWGFEKLYSAWKALMQEKNIPVQDWEQEKETLTDNRTKVDELAAANPQLLAADYRTFVPQTSRLVMTENAENLAKAELELEKYAQRYEFLPGSARDNLANDYRLLVDICRSRIREADNIARIDAWIERIQRDPAINDLVNRTNTRHMSKAEKDFYQTYVQYCKGNSVEKVLSRSRLGADFDDMAMSAMAGLELLKFVWGESVYALGSTQDPNSVLYGFRYASQGMDDKPGFYLYHGAVQAGVDPESLPGFVGDLRAANIRQRMTNHEFSEAVMHLGAWRKEDENEIVRFAQRIAREMRQINGRNMSTEEINLRMRELIGGRNGDPLSANAEDTLIANFDRTFGKYFNPDKLEDSDTFSHILCEGSRMSDIFNEYAYNDVFQTGISPDEQKAAARKAKVEIMTRILAGERVEVEKVDSAGAVRRQMDGTVETARLNLETDQPELVSTVEAVRNMNGWWRERASRLNVTQAYLDEFRHQYPNERISRLHNIFRTALDEAHKEIAPSDQDIENVQARGFEQAKKALEAEGIFDGAAHSVLGAREVADIQRAARALEVYRDSLPAAQARAYSGYLAMLERNCQELDRLRMEQELMRHYPEMQERMVSLKRVPPGVSLDNLMDTEADKLYRSSMALAQMLRYGVGEITSEERISVMAGNDRSELRELLEGEGNSIGQVLTATEAIRQSIPANGNRFAVTDVITADMGGAGREVVDNLMSPDSLRSLDGLGPDARQCAVQCFDPVFGRIFGDAERARLAEQGMDIYDCIFVEGRSLSDLYRQTPEKRSYEKMESDLKCRFMEHMLAGERIDVMVTDAAGQEKLARLQPYDSTGVMAENSAVPAVPMRRRPRPNREAQIRSSVEESRRRLQEIINDPKARRNREEYIRYAHRDRTAEPVPMRKGFAAESAALQKDDDILTTALPLGNRPSDALNPFVGGALYNLWCLQRHQPGELFNHDYTQRLRIPANIDSLDPSGRLKDRLKTTFDMADKMFANILQMGGGDGMDPAGGRAGTVILY